MEAGGTADLGQDGDLVIAILVVGAVIAFVVTLLPAQGRMGRNAVAGVRTRSTMRDDESWRRGHQAALLPTAVGAGTTTVWSVGALTVGHGNDTVAILIGAGILVAGTLWGVWAAERALR